MFRCEHCSKSLSLSDVRFTYTISARFQDQSDAVYIQFIGEQGDQIMGLPAKDFKDLKEQAGPEQVRDLINQCNFDYHTITVRAKIDDYQQNMGG